MILVVLTAVLAVSGAAKLDRSYLPPASAKTAGGSPGAILAPIVSQPSGSYTNDAEGVVVDAVAPGTRTSGAEPTGLGGPRTSYGSTNSKVGDAAFTGFNGPSTRIAPGFGSIAGVEEGTGGPSIRIAPGFSSILAPEVSDEDKTRLNTLKYTNEIGSENYSYGFETANGIAVGENGVAADGVKANGEYSYKGDDGKVYSVSYTADEGGYKPQGSHLPTPPPIPQEILVSLEQNAKEEAAGVVDDGTYDAQKYNDEGDYTSNNGAGNNNRPSVSSGGASSSGSFVSHGNQGIKSTGTHGIDSHQTAGNVQGTHGFGSHGFGNQNTGFGLKDQNKPQGFLAGSSSSGVHGHGVQFGQNQFGAQASNQGPNQGFGLHSHSTQNRFGVQPIKSDVSSASAVASSNNGFNVQGVPSLHGHPGLRLPASSSSAFSSAVATGSGSANAFASTGLVGPDFKNKGSKFGSDSTGGASFPDFTAVNPTDASIATATASAEGQGSSAQALSTSSPTFGSTDLNKAPGLIHNTYGSNIYYQNQQSNGVKGNEYLPPVNIVETTGPVHHGSNIHAASPVSSPTSATASASVSGKPSFNYPGQNFNTFGTGSSGAQSQVSQNGDSFPTTFGQTPSHVHGSDAATAASSLGSQQPGFPSQTFNSKPGQYTQTGSAFPTASGQAQFPNNNIRPGSQANQPGSGFPSVVTPTKVPATELSTPFESNEHSDNGKLPSANPTQPTFSTASQQPSNFGSTFPSQINQYKPQGAQGSLIQTGANGASFGLSSPKPSLNQQQGSDSSYYYNQPAKPFVTPINQYQTSKFPSSSGSSGQNSNNQQLNVPQQGPKYPNTPVAPNPSSKPTLDSNYYNGVTQASISPFPSPAPTPSSQFGSKPTKSDPSTSQNEFGTSGSQQNFNQKPNGYTQTQYGQVSSSQTGSNQTPSQQGTIYQYNKPSTPGQSALSQIDSQDKPVQTSFGSTQFGHQQSKPYGSNSQSSLFQHSQTGSTFGSQSTSQAVSKPQGTQSTSGSQNQFAPVPSSYKPFGSHVGSNYPQTQFGSVSGSQFGKKPSVSAGSSFQQAQKPLTSQSGGQQNQGTLYEYNKPDVNLPSDKEEIVESTSSTASSQSNLGSSLNSASQGQNTPSIVKPFGGTQSTQSSVFGSQTSTQSGYKPQISGFGSSQTGSQFGQKVQSGHSSTFTQVKPISQFGSQSTPTQFGQTQASQSGFPSATQTTKFENKPISTTQFGGSQTGSSFQQSQFGLGQKHQPTQGSTFASVGQTQNEKKPVSTSQTGSSFTQSQTSFGHQPTIQTGQKPLTNQASGFGTQTGSAFQQNQFGSFGSQLGQKPQSNQGSGFPSTIQTSQFGKKPFGTAQTGSTFQQTNTVQGSSFGQTSSQFGQKQTNQVVGFGSSQLGTSFQQNQFSSTFGSQKPQSVGTVVKPEVQPTSQYGQKPKDSQSIQSTTAFAGTQSSQQPQGTVGSSSSTLPTRFDTKPGSQFGTIPNSFGQRPQTSTPSKGQSVHTTQFGQQSFGAAQTTNQFGSSTTGQTTQGTGSQFGTIPTLFGQKPQTSIPSKGQSVQTTQFGQPTFGAAQTTNQVGSSTTGQTTQGTGSQVGAIPSHFGQKPNQVSSLSSNTQASQLAQKQQTSTTSLGQSVQTNQFGQQTFGAAHTNQYGNSATSQTPQSTSLNTGTVSQTTTSFGQKPQVGFSSQQTAFGAGSQFGQKLPGTQGTFNSGVSKGQTIQTTQYGVKPFSTFSQTQFGNKFGQTPQKTGTISQTATLFGQNPSGVSQAGYQQNNFGSTPSSTTGQKPLSSQSPSFTSNTASKDQSGVTTFSVKPIESSQPAISSFSQSQFGSSTGSLFGQKPQSGVGTQSSSNPQIQSISQYGIKPFGSQSTLSSLQQTQFGSSASNIGQNVQGHQLSGSSIGSSFTQTNSGSSFSSGLKPQSSSGSTSPVTTQIQPISQFANKPFGSQFTQVAGQKTQTGSVSGTQSSQTFGNQGQVGQIQFGQKPFGGSQSSSLSGQKPQNSASAFASSTGSFGGNQFGQGSSSFGSAGTQSQKPFGSTLTQTTQQQYSQTANQFGVQSKKPFGSSQTVFQQPQSFGQKPLTNQGSALHIGQAADQKTQSTQSNIHTSVTSVSAQSSGQSASNVESFEGYNYQKPQITTGSQFGGQKTPAQSGFIGQSTSSPHTGESAKPFSTPATLGSFEQSLSTVGSQFGVQPTKSSDLNTPLGSQTSKPQFSGQSYQTVTTIATPVANPGFGVQPTKPTSQFGQTYKPFIQPTITIDQLQSSKPTSHFGAQPTQGAIVTSPQLSQSLGAYGSQPNKPNVFGSAPSTSFPSVGLGSQDSSNQGSSISTVQTPISVQEVNKQSSSSFVGKGEVFGGPRDPPKFDDKTGYHY